MSPELAAFLVGSVGGPVGGALSAIAGATVLRRVGSGVRGAILAFAGGFIAAVAFLELLQRGLENTSGWQILAVLTGLATGAALRWLITRLVGGPEHHLGERQPGHGDESAYRGGQARKIALSLAMVNVVEGLTIGVGFAVGTGLGLLLGAIMIFENFTEGLSVSTELAQGEQDTRQMFLLTTAPTLTLGIGGAIGAFLGGLSPLMLAGLLGAGAGIMLYVMIDDIIFDAHQLGPGVISTAPFLTGVIVGTAIAGRG